MLTVDVSQREGVASHAPSLYAASSLCELEALVLCSYAVDLWVVLQSQARFQGDLRGQGGEADAHHVVLIVTEDLAMRAQFNRKTTRLSNDDNAALVRGDIGNVQTDIDG